MRLTGILVGCLLCFGGCSAFFGPDPVIEAMAAQGQTLRQEYLQLQSKGQALVQEAEDHKKAQQTLTEDSQQFGATLTIDQVTVIAELDLLMRKQEISEFAAWVQIEKLLIGDQKEIFSALLARDKELAGKYVDLNRKFSDWQAECKANEQRWKEFRSLALAYGDQLAYERKLYEDSLEVSRQRRVQQQELYQLQEINRNLQNLGIQQQNQQLKRGGVLVIPSVPTYPY